jgi:hypothetical protein
MVSRKVSKAVKQDYAKERKEHPWASPSILRRIAKDHVKHTGEGNARIIVERTVMIPVASKKKKRPVIQVPWYNRLY